jgi:hypothetical protein
MSDRIIIECSKCEKTIDITDFLDENALRFYKMMSERNLSKHFPMLLRYLFSNGTLHKNIITPFRTDNPKKSRSKWTIYRTKERRDETLCPKHHLAQVLESNRTIIATMRRKIDKAQKMVYKIEKEGK